MQAYNKTVAEVEKELDTSVQNGLTSAQAAERLEKYGPNSLKEEKPKSLLQKFLEQFKDFMIIILLIASVLSLILDEAVDAIIIMLVIFINAVLGVVQESRAEKALEALKKISAPYAKVLRDGKKESILAANVVPGDVVFLEAGDLVPADARLFSVANLMVEESSLTGESVPVEKHTQVIPDEDVPLGDRKNMVFATGIVTYGRGMCIVTGTGMNTQVGRIADMLTTQREDTTPLQKRLAHIGKFLGIIALCICALIFVLGLINRVKVFEMFMTSVSLAVAAIPEGLPAIVTIVLAVGVQRMVKQNAIIRRLPAVETLGSASVICSDKTGTLTQNRMTVKKVYVNGEVLDIIPENFSAMCELLEYAALCNDGKVIEEEGKLKHIGDPTETALVAAAHKCGLDKDELEERFPRVAELPFDSDRKMMTTVHKMEGGYISITKGAPDIVISRCVDASYEALAVNSQMGRQALRVLAVGIKRLDVLPEKADSAQLENGLELIGLLGMIDPPREEVKDAVQTCKRAGI
ncbi:MAG TPA: HAD-IC family P-type ATPase, partial [Clostridia bacterium]|nr:HAD-IC family P-type ATPase [Clostridia bacterium]